MRYSTRIKPISYLKANAAEILATLGEQREPLVITQNGEAKAVLQDVASYEETQETLALLKILDLGQQDVQAGRVKPVADVVARLRADGPAFFQQGGIVGLPAMIAHELNVVGTAISTRFQRRDDFADRQLAAFERSGSHNSTPTRSPSAIDRWRLTWTAATSSSLSRG